MSYLFSRALAEEYSAGTSLDGEQFAQLNVMPTPHKFSRNDKTMESSDLSRFGLTCAVLTESRGEELLTSYLEVSRARTSHLQEVEPASMEADPDFGDKWRESSVKYDLDSCSWKTHLCLWEEDLQWSLVTLPKWGLIRSGVVYQHQTLERPISVTVSGLSPTPRASMGSHGIAWCRARTGEHRHNLEDWLAHQHILSGGLETPGLNVSPSYAEWLMKWPSGWTDLKPLGMDRFQAWLQQHSTFSQIPEVKNPEAA